MKVLPFAAAAIALVVSPAVAETYLTGKDAAHIDWSVKNCVVTSTDKEHAMVDQANARGKDQFIAQWFAESAKLAEAANTPSKRDEKCSDIKSWYGPAGSRIAGLISWTKETSSSTPKSKSARQGSASRRGRGQGAGVPF